MKSAYLLHKQGFVDSQTVATVGAVGAEASILFKFVDTSITLSCHCPLLLVHFQANVQENIIQANMLSNFLPGPYLVILM